MTEHIRFTKDNGAFKSGDIVEAKTEEEVKIWLQVPGVELVQPEAKEIKPKPDINKVKPEPEIPKKEIAKSMRITTEIVKYPDEPILNENGEPYWLSINYKKISTTTNLENKKMIEIAIANKPLVDVPEFTLKNQHEYKCHKCCATIISNSHEPEVCTQCNRTSTFTRLHDEINPDLWSIPHWEDINNLDPKQMYEDLVTISKKLIIFNDQVEYKIFILWIISTWKLEAWDTVGYPCFIGPPNSGKSTALRFISRLGYRAPKASAIKQAAIPRLCHYWNVTLLVDEAHDKLNSRGETSAELLAFVKDSYKRGSTYITCDNNDQKKLFVTRNFGFKAFAGERTFKPSVLSRAIVFLMDKANPEVAKFNYVENDIQRLQTQLINYRVKTGVPPDLSNDFILKGRTREIFESIIATARHIGIQTDDIIEYAKERDNEIEEEIKQSTQCEVLEIIKKYIDDPHELPDYDRLEFSRVFDDLGWNSTDDETLRKNRQQLGYIFSNLGLKIKRSDNKRFFAFEDKANKKRLSELFKRFGFSSEKQTKLKGTEK